MQKGFAQRLFSNIGQSSTWLGTVKLISSIRKRPGIVLVVLGGLIFFAAVIILLFISQFMSKCNSGEHTLNSWLVFQILNAKPASEEHQAPRKFSVIVYAIVHAIPTQKQNHAPSLSDFFGSIFSKCGACARMFS
jgi:hypothetical protein